MRPSTVHRFAGLGECVFERPGRGNLVNDWLTAAKELGHARVRKTVEEICAIDDGAGDLKVSALASGDCL